MMHEPFGGGEKCNGEKQTSQRTNHSASGGSQQQGNPNAVYDLVAVVIHCGSGLNRGHYISIVRSGNLWLLFDDDLVEVNSEQQGFCLLQRNTQRRELWQQVPVRWPIIL